ncbi:FAD-binding domain-containing protein [Lenzites betulinus]|nr:FAD-binding domain-containing protein [Lenzites betulinus]
MGALAFQLSGPPPFSAALEALNASLSGGVHYVVPFARPCFAVGTVLGIFDNATCAHVIETYTDVDTVTSTFSAYLNSAGTICEATGDQCLLDGFAPSDSEAFLPPRQCLQGNLPDFYIDVQSPADVSAAFDFARQTKTPISIKNTGHDYVGRSAGAGSVALWMHNLQNIAFDADFVPSGCKQAGTPAVTFGTGVLAGTLSEFADAHNITLPGGADRFVALGGGYILVLLFISSFTNAFGLAVDRVLQFEVVTPDSVHRIVNACSYPDLFFALRGGGPGFGAVLNVTMKALPKLSPFPVIATTFKETPDIAVQTKYIEFLIDKAFALASKGWGGYIVPSVGLSLVNPFVSMEEAEETTADLKLLMETELNGTFILTLESSYLSFYNDFVVPQQLPNNVPSALSSRLIPASVFNSTAAMRAELSDAIVTATQRHTLTCLFPVTPFYFGQGDGKTSVTPAWRDAIWHVFYVDFWNYDTTPDEIAQIHESLEEDAEALRRIAPDSGAYSNEASLLEPDYAQAFWGSNYKRLLAIKSKYDPDHLLDCWKCVGWRGASSPQYKCQQNQ